VGRERLGLGRGGDPADDSRACRGGRALGAGLRAQRLLTTPYGRSATFRAECRPIPLVRGDISVRRGAKARAAARLNLAFGQGGFIRSWSGVRSRSASVAARA